MDFSEFQKQYPNYHRPLLDTIRAEEFPQLKGVYVDWTGAALAPQVLLESHYNFLSKNILGNPHSHHMPSAFAMQNIVETRAAILKHVNADPNEYEVIFTSGATGAILILQHYMFESGELLLTADNHNSVNGLRELAKRKGAVVRYTPINDDLTFDAEALERAINFPRSSGNKLFCYPAKSNYSGQVHSLDWIKVAQDKGWDVLLDAAAYLSNNRLDLHEFKPDFVPISFYKLFGYPTGLGCLIIKKEKYAKLSKRWFSGGSILLVSVMKDFFAPESIGYARFEDGTINFGGIPAIKAGLQYLDSLGEVKHRALSLASSLHEQLSSLNENGNTVVVHSNKGNDTVTFSVKKGGEIINAWLFEQAANEQSIYVRTGCFCNPGVNEKVFNYTVDQYERFYNDALSPDKMTIEELAKYSNGQPIGAIRASFGYINNYSDVEEFVQFTKMFLKA
jgi:molybdenum cofactor sulfurtransferase